LWFFNRLEYYVNLRQKIEIIVSFSCGTRHAVFGSKKPWDPIHFLPCLTGTFHFVQVRQNYTVTLNVGGQCFDEFPNGEMRYWEMA
jgi:hypothetical protein